MLTEISAFQNSTTATYSNIAEEAQNWLKIRACVALLHESAGGAGFPQPN